MPAPDVSGRSSPPTVTIPNPTSRLGPFLQGIATSNLCHNWGYADFCSQRNKHVAFPTIACHAAVALRTGHALSAGSPPASRDWEGVFAGLTIFLNLSTRNLIVMVSQTARLDASVGGSDPRWSVFRCPDTRRCGQVEFSVPDRDLSHTHRLGNRLTGGGQQKLTTEWNPGFANPNQFADQIANETLKTFDPQFAALTALSAATEKTFGLRFFTSPQAVVAAPGRVNLIGEHIDYNDGFVLPMAIDRYTVLAGSKCDGDKCRIYAADLDQEYQLDLATPVEPPTGDAQWYDYIRGVVAGFQQYHAVPAFELVISSAVPLGSGLSSSAALEVAIATFLEWLTGHRLGQTSKALLAQTAEHRFAKVPCGIMDQFSSVFGQDAALMLLDCRDQTLEQVPFDSEEISVLIANTNVKHALTGGEYGQRRSQCEQALAKIGRDSYRGVQLSDLEAVRDSLSDVEYRRARHVVSEIARTVEAAAAIRKGAWDRAGELMAASHVSLRDDFEVSCPELDAMVTAAGEAGTSLGVIGSRMTGGGFGGCTVSLVRHETADQAAQFIARRYQETTGREPTLFLSRPAQGAHVVKPATTT